MENIIANKNIKERKKFSISRVFVYGTLILYTLFLFIPFYTIIVTAFTDHIELTSSAEFIWWPKNFSLQGFKNLIEYDDMYLTTGVPSIVRGFFNTIWMSTLPTIVGLFFSGLAAYVYTKINLPGKNVFFAIEMATMMIPLSSMQIVSYMFYNSVLNWNGTPLPLIVPSMFGGAGTIFFLRMYFEGVGNEIIEAAKIDGKSFLGIYITILIPLAVPAFIAQFVFAFVARYNDYVGPLLYLTGNDKMITLQLATSNLRSSFSKYHETICASAIFSMVPLIIVYCFCQKLFIKGIAVGGSKE